MTEVTVVVACRRCRVSWSVDAPPRCPEPGHEHVTVEVHRHRTPVVLPDGSRLHGVSFDPVAPYERDRAPDFGLYLDDLWRPPWTHGRVAWPDFGLPSDAVALDASLRDVLDRARSGQRVEVGCAGGHGRTGTALACLAVLTGVVPADAVAWVRGAYCPDAVETTEQSAFVAAFAPSAGAAT